MEQALKEITEILNTKQSFSKSDRYLIKITLRDLYMRNKEAKEYAQAHLVTEYIENSKLAYIIKILEGNDGK